jgi:hypothetical protein
MNFCPTSLILYFDLPHNVFIAKPIASDQWVTIQRHKVRTCFMLRLFILSQGPERLPD